MARVTAVSWLSPVLALKQVKVTGSELVDNSEVSEQVLDQWGGVPLPQVRPGQVEKAVLADFPKLQEASIHYSGPQSLTIELTDRTPVLAMETEDGFRLYDSDAVDLGTVDTAPDGLTLLSDSGTTPDTETVAAVIRFLAELRPELRQQLVTISAKSPDTLTGTIDTGEAKAEVVFGDDTSASLKMRTAAQLAADGRTEVDVSVPSVPVTN